MTNICFRTKIMSKFVQIVITTANGLYQSKKYIEEKPLSMNKIERLLIKEFTSKLSTEEKAFLDQYRQGIKSRSKTIAKTDEEEEVRLKKKRESGIADWQKETLAAK